MEKTRLKEGLRNVGDVTYRPDPLPWGTDSDMNTKKKSNSKYIPNNILQNNPLDAPTKLVTVAHSDFSNPSNRHVTPSPSGKKTTATPPSNRIFAPRYPIVKQEKLLSVAKSDFSKPSVLGEPPKNLSSQVQYIDSHLSKSLKLSTSNHQKSTDKDKRQETLPKLSNKSNHRNRNTFIAETYIRNSFERKPEDMIDLKEIEKRLKKSLSVQSDLVNTIENLKKKEESKDIKNDSKVSARNDNIVKNDTARLKVLSESDYLSYTSRTRVDSSTHKKDRPKTALETSRSRYNNSPSDFETIKEITSNTLLPLNLSKKNSLSTSHSSLFQRKDTQIENKTTINVNKQSGGDIRNANAERSHFSLKNDQEHKKLSKYTNT